MSENPYQPPDEVQEPGRQHQKTPPAAPAGGPLAFAALFVALIVLFFLIVGALGVLIVAVMHFVSPFVQLG